MEEVRSKLANCTATGKDVCRHVYIMNLALGYVEDFYCLEALAEMHNKTPKEIYDFAYGYVDMRECFRKEWDKIDNCIKTCPVPEFS